MLPSCLPHVDHPGVPNPQLIKERASIASVFKMKSIAEQNSFDIGWKLFLDPAYSDLHACLFYTKEEFLRFRQIVINGVMATDIFDPQLNKMMEVRWRRAFLPSACDDKTCKDRKATIILEFVVRASDLSHTMQCWSLYEKWNRSLRDVLCLQGRPGRHGPR